MISYVDYFVYWYTYEAIGKWFMYTLGKVLHVNFLGYANWFMSISILQMKDHPISVDQARYATYIVDKYMYNSTVKASTNFYKTTFPSDMIFTKDDAYTSDEKVEKLTKESNIHHRVCIASLIYLLSTRVYFCFEVHNLSNFQTNPGKVTLRDWYIC